MNKQKLVVTSVLIAIVIISVTTLMMPTSESSYVYTHNPTLQKQIQIL